MKEFPLVKGGCNHSAQSVEFSAVVMAGCMIAAVALVLIMVIF